jgi:transposase
VSGVEASDYKGYEPLMLEPGPEPKVSIADKGYDSDATRKDLIARRAEPVIPMRRNRKAQVSIDGAIYALRNLIERRFNRLKHSRRLATRYDKTIESYPGFVLIASARLWCRHLVNTAWFFIEAMKAVFQREASARRWRTQRAEAQVAGTPSGSESKSAPTGESAPNPADFPISPSMNRLIATAAVAKG